MAGLYDAGEANYAQKEEELAKDNRRDDINERLMDAIERGDLEETKGLIEQGAQPNTNGLNALHKAAFHGKLAIVRYLVTFHGMDPNTKDKNGFTPLHRAAYNGSLEVCKCLVHEAKADIWEVNREGMTATQIAQKYGQKKTADWLLSKQIEQPPPCTWVEVSGSVYENSRHFKSAMELVGCRIKIAYGGGFFSKKQWVEGTVIKYNEYKVRHQVRFDDGSTKWEYLDFKHKPQKYKFLRAVPSIKGIAQVVSTPSDFEAVSSAPPDDGGCVMHVPIAEIFTSTADSVQEKMKMNENENQPKQL
eukprot:CAMPEP_0204829840 /NCGR_PEP_ID=MMETSP1346-20131115/8179_1 /ASSEMBLY_ACC=CAM_ASM_000771 /TAXON_ID=215587 /ORGANISM="Aplanochytrium stocchinoi, Strain GSBS06" /LENGTH=303 /DNA_ID=CAMNT_0051959929 /DNA_START=202 /DNA_END=1113 /DNA_ORIENTATION=-